MSRYASSGTHLRTHLILIRVRCSLVCILLYIRSIYLVCTDERPGKKLKVHWCVLLWSTNLEPSTNMRCHQMLVHYLDGKRNPNYLVWSTVYFGGTSTIGILQAIVADFDTKSLLLTNFGVASNDIDLLLQGKKLAPESDTKSMYNNENQYRCFAISTHHIIYTSNARTNNKNWSFFFVCVCSRSIRRRAQLACISDQMTSQLVHLLLSRSIFTYHTDETLLSVFI